MKKLRIFFVDAGSCNGCSIEILSMLGHARNCEMADSPRDADLLVVSGVGTVKTAEPLPRIYKALKEPKRAIAIGSCAISGNAFDKAYTFAGPIDKLVKIDLYIPGCPPQTCDLVDGIRKIFPDMEFAGHVCKPRRGKLSYAREACIGCGQCIAICPSEAIRFAERQGKRKVGINMGKCTFCGQCVAICPVRAIKFTGAPPESTADKKTLVIG